MNFIETFKQGQAGRNLGLTTGIPALDEAINGIQKKTSIGLTAAPKVGKTTLADYSFVISPYLQAEARGTLDKLRWTYFSYEIDRVSKEYKYAAFFMAHDFQQYNFHYKNKLYLMNQDYLMGKLIHRNPNNTTEMIPVTEAHAEMLKVIYEKRIIPIFGEYSADNRLITPGKIHFIEEPENPTGLNKLFWHYAKRFGQFIEEPYEITDKETGKVEKRSRVVGYKEDDPDIFHIFITDHVRKLRRERGFSMKENIDKFLEYTTWFRNTCNFIFVNICHSNRDVGNVERLRFAGEFIYPTADDVKDTGNLAEESTILLTMFNPTDEKYNLKKHFGVELADHPNYRSIHVAESRFTESPQHLRTKMIGGINLFTPLIY